MYTPFENYVENFVGEDGRFSQTMSPGNPPLLVARVAELQEKLAAAKKELSELKTEPVADQQGLRKIEIAQRYARMLEEASLTVVGAEGRAVVKEALEHYCRYLMESL